MSHPKPSETSCAKKRKKPVAWKLRPGLFKTRLRKLSRQAWAKPIALFGWHGPLVKPRNTQASQLNLWDEAACIGTDSYPVISKAPASLNSLPFNYQKAKIADMKKPNLFRLG
jgi:hypothetical protein